MTKTNKKLNKYLAEIKKGSDAGNRQLAAKQPTRPKQAKQQPAFHNVARTLWG